MPVLQPFTEGTPAMANGKHALLENVCKHVEMLTATLKI